MLFARASKPNVTVTPSRGPLDVLGSPAYECSTGVSLGRSGQKVSVRTAPTRQVTTTLKIPPIWRALSAFEYDRRQHGQRHAPPCAAHTHTQGDGRTSQRISVQPVRRELIIIQAATTMARHARPCMQPHARLSRAAARTHFSRTHQPGREVDRQT